LKNKFEFPTEIEEKLLRAFSWASSSYSEGIKDIPEDDLLSLSVSDMAHEDLYAPIKKYFLRGLFPREKMHLDIFFKDSSILDEELFDRAFEDLLIWAGQYLYINPNCEKEFLRIFKQGFFDNPAEVVLAPIYRLSRDQQNLIKCIKLSENVLLVEPDFIERQSLRHECRSLGKANHFPLGFHNTLPDLMLKITIPNKLRSPEIWAEANSVISNFRVIMCGIFDSDIEIPFYFKGLKYPWSPWIINGIQYPKEFPYDASYRSISDMDMRLIEKYWINIGAKTLKQYDITATRLQQAKSRKILSEKVVDLSIALEGLFQEESELNFRYSTITASIVEKDPEKRFGIYALFKSFYGLRSKIVHGKSIESNKEWSKLSSAELLEKLRPVEYYIRRLLRLHLLNKNLRNNAEQIKIMLGADIRLVDHVSVD
jgi:hypothetical protein